jgi:hypothetical protein
MKHIFFLVFSLLLITSQSQAATEISPGVLYPSGSDLKVSSHGIEFKVPDNWQAMLPPESDLLIMEPTGSVSRIFFTMAANSNAQAVKQIMSRSQALDAMTRIKPSAQVTEQDGLFTQSYQVTGVNLQKLVATAYARLGDNKTAVFVIMLEPEDQKSLPALGKQLIQSVVFSATQTAAQLRSEAGKNIDWERVIRGRTLEYIQTDDGSSTKKTMSLCSNGRFYYTEQETYLSKNAMSNISAKTQTAQNGHWQVAGDQLQLFWSDGSQTQYNLSKRPVAKGDEAALFLDEEHWSYNRNRACH